MAGVIEGVRWSLTGRTSPPGRVIFVSSAAVVIFVVSGVAYFQKVETTVADVV
jgi:ABC-type polysaccharide/polyol phosphate export permease